MSLELKNIEARKTELQGELKKVETQLVEVLSNVELLKQKKFSILGAITLCDELIVKNDSDNNGSSIPQTIVGV
jgi:SMC interacting uncharacterized protein involved in chromosome segregation|tara:strand:- start:783 stop:1004 length:222 start_codon:yes stop_codon:yes gene_type:complete